MNEEGLKIKVNADTKEASSEIESFGQKASGMFGKLAKLIAGLGLLGFVKSSVQGFKDMELAQAEFNAAMEQMEVPQHLIDSLHDFSEAAEKAFGIDADDISKGLASLARLTGSGEAVDNLKDSLLNLSIGMGLGIESSAKMISRALNNGLSSLSRLGIVATEEQLKIWDDFGDDMEAKSEFLNDLLNEKFGGAAAAYGDTAAGAAEKATKAFDMFKDELGEKVLPVMTGLLKVFTAITDVMGGLPNLLTVLGAAWLAFAVISKAAMVIQGKAVDGLIIKYLAMGIAYLWAINPLLAVVGGALMLAGIVGLIYGIGALLSGIGSGGSSGDIPSEVKEELDDQDKEDDKDKETIVNVTINQDNMGDWDARTESINNTQTNIRK